MTKPQHPLFIYKIREINTFFLVLVKLQREWDSLDGTPWEGKGWNQRAGRGIQRSGKGGQLELNNKIRSLTCKQCWTEGDTQNLQGLESPLLRELPPFPSSVNPRRGRINIPL